MTTYSNIMHTHTHTHMQRKPENFSGEREPGILVSLLAAFLFIFSAILLLPAIIIIIIIIIIL